MYIVCYIHPPTRLASQRRRPDLAAPITPFLRSAQLRGCGTDPHIGLWFYVHTYYSERDTLSVVAALYGFLFFDKARFLASKRIFSSFFFPVAWPIRV